MSAWRRQFLTLMSALCLSWNSQAEQASVAVASNFIAPMKAIAARFEQHSGHQLRLSFASSGKLYAQIRHGAPYHLLLSADQAKPQALIDDQLALPNSRFTYATGRLALLYASTTSTTDNNGQNHLAQWVQQGDGKLAIANPKLAPYGLAAQQVLQRLGHYSDLQSRLVFGENINQAYQFVASGNARLGLVALAQVQQQTTATGRYWIVPASLHLPIKQDAVILNPGRDNIAANALVTYLQRADIQSLIATYGYR